MAGETPAPLLQQQLSEVEKAVDPDGIKVCGLFY